MRLVNVAWDVLGNPKKKAQYDQRLRGSSRPARKRQATTRPPEQRPNPTRQATASSTNTQRTNTSTSRPIDEQSGDGSVSIWASIPVLILIGVLVGVFVVVTFVDNDRDNRPQIRNSPELSAGDCFVLVGNTPREVGCESGNAVGQVTEVGPDPGNCPDGEDLPLQDPESDFYLCWARIVPGSSNTVPPG